MAAVVDPREAASILIRENLDVLSTEVCGPSAKVHSAHVVLLISTSSRGSWLFVTCDSPKHGHAVASALRDGMMRQLVAEGAWQP